MPPGREVHLLGRKAEILAHDIVSLLYNQYNLATFDYGFTTIAYDLFFPPAADQKRIQAIEEIETVADDTRETAETSPHYQ